MCKIETIINYLTNLKKKQAPKNQSIASEANTEAITRVVKRRNAQVALEQDLDRPHTIVIRHLIKTNRRRRVAAAADRLVQTRLPPRLS